MSQIQCNILAIGITGFVRSVTEGFAGRSLALPAGPHIYQTGNSGIDPVTMGSLNERD